MKIEIHPDFSHLESKILDILKHFEAQGETVYKGSRNVIKTFDVEEFELNIKAFKKPNFFKKIIYTFFRPSKAKRSFLFAQKLKEFGIGTPQPIAFIEERDSIGLSKSYYICKHIKYDMMFRELVSHPDLKDRENILNQFTQFCYKLHENGIEFKDHSPGNTLIKAKEKGKYEFFLVDLNRMKFHESMSIKQRMYNLRRLTPQLEMVSLITEEYARLSNENSEDLFRILWEYTSDFQKKFHKKKRLKKKLKL